MLFRLRTPHIIGGAMRNAGTIVGPYGSVMENGPAPLLYVGDPTPDMEGVDDEGRAKVNEVYNRLHGSDAPWHMEPAEPGRPPVPGQAAAPERPYSEDHPDYAEINPDEQNKLNAEMAEANQRHWAGHGTAPVETLPRPGAQMTAVRPMEARTPQDQVMSVDRPLAQQLPDAMGGAAAGSPAVQISNTQAQQMAEGKTPPPPAPRRTTSKDEEE